MGRERWDFIKWRSGHNANAGGWGFICRFDNMDGVRYPNLASRQRRRERVSCLPAVRPETHLSPIHARSHKINARNRAAAQQVIQAGRLGRV
jgi:hypothetical protein